MVDLDYGLIYRARHLITGANIHHVKRMIFAYKQAVQLHNDGWPGHSVYQQQYEEALRSFTQSEVLSRA